MKSRSISSVIYVLVVGGFFLLREFVDYRLFNILIWFFAGVGIFELTRALKPYLLKGYSVIAVIFGIAFIPLFCVFEYLFEDNIGAYVCILAILTLFLAMIVQTFISNSSLSSLGITMLNIAYPALLLLCWSMANELSYGVGFISLLLIFVVSALSDSMAYLVGMIYNKIRKGNAKKLCPLLSPKKTIAGAIGGIIGGVVGALLVYLIFKGYKSNNLPFYIYIIAGAVGSVLTEIGDLFESGIKRRVGIKDMGKIMPGHGGIMDRIDGMSFAGAFIYLLFSLI